MHLKQILQKRDKLSESKNQSQQQSQSAPAPPPGFKFIRSDTTSQEIIDPPVYDEDHEGHDRKSEQPQLQPRPSSPSSTPAKNRLSIFSRSRSRSHSRSRSRSRSSDEKGNENQHRLSHLFHLDRDRARSSSSLNIPADLPLISDGDESGDAQDREAKWEKRATLLVGGAGPGAAAALGEVDVNAAHANTSANTAGTALPASRSSSLRSAVDLGDDVSVQEAIRLHEAGKLEPSTKMFGHLADPNGANNALSQVLYGLALRHGWGCPPDPVRAVRYLQSAATNSATIESEALQAGVKKGGAAKGELVLAIFELGNCFRNGWGVEKDAEAARQYFETAANLGDADAMNEVAWCYLEGFGGRKDKYMAAKYYRLAEENGNRTLGNSWIWKGKYNPKT